MFWGETVLGADDDGTEGLDDGEEGVEPVEAIGGAEAAAVEVHDADGLCGGLVGVFGFLGAQDRGAERAGGAGDVDFGVADGVFFAFADGVPAQASGISAGIELVLWDEAAVFGEAVLRGLQVGVEGRAGERHRDEIRSTEYGVKEYLKAEGQRGRGAA